MSAISTLVIIRWESNVGYAITSLERLFFQTAMTLAEGRQDLVHFAYRSLSHEPPAALPAGFANVSVMNMVDTSAGNLARIEQMVRERGPDLVIAFDVQPDHPSFAAMRRAGVRTIVSYWGAPISSPQPAWKRTIKRWLLELSRSRADGLIFESQAMADLAVQGRGVPPRLIDVVPIGVDTERFRPARSDYVHEALGIPRDRKVVVFSGHCVPRKGIQTLMEAAILLLAERRRTDLCVVVCGNKGDESRPYEQMYEGRGIGSWIRFAGYRRDMLEIFQSAFCGVIPSTGWDSFTVSAVEMAATGLPVVASRLQGLAEAVLHERTGLLFTPGSAPELADAIARLLDHPDEAAAFGRAGRERCERELNLATQREAFLRAVSRHLPTPVSAAAVAAPSR